MQEPFRLAGPLIAALLGVIAFSLVSPSMAAASEKSVGVAPIEATGTVDHGDAIDDVSLSRIRADVVEVFDRAGLDGGALDGGCESADCWSERARELGVDLVLAISIASTGSDHSVSFEVREADSGELVTSSEDACEICGREELREHVTAQGAVLAKRLKKLGPTPALVGIDGAPRGAPLYVDGDLVGTLPWEGEVVPGRHTIRVESPGYVPQDRVITATAGVREHLAVRLRPDVVETPVRDASAARAGRGAAVAGWTLVGVGAAATGVGVGLWITDGRPHRDSCPADVVDADGECPNIYSSRPAGIGLTAAGGALVVTGAGLLIYSRTRDRRTRARLHVSPIRYGARLDLRF